MLSLAWHAEREPRSGLLDIFSHALLSRPRGGSSQLRGRSYRSDARSPRCRCPLQPRGWGRGRPAGLTRGHLSRWLPAPSPKRCSCSTAEVGPAATGRERQWGKEPCSPPEGTGEGRERRANKVLPGCSATLQPAGGGLLGHSVGREQLHWAARPTGRAQAFGAALTILVARAKGQVDPHVRRGRGGASAASPAVPAPSRGVPSEGFGSTRITRCPALTHWEKQQPKQKGSFSPHELPKRDKPRLLLAAVRPRRGRGPLSNQPARWRLPGEVSPVTHCWQGINNQSRAEAGRGDAAGKEKGPLWGAPRFRARERRLPRGLRDGRSSPSGLSPCRHSGGKCLTRWEPGPWPRWHV